jgi:hypothetical protein
MTNKQQLIAAIALFMAVLWGMAYIIGRLTFEHWASFPAFVTAAIGMVGSAGWALASIIRMAEERDRC